MRRSACASLELRLGRTLIGGQVYVDVDLDELYLGLALACQVNAASFHLLPDHPRVDQEQATCHLDDGDNDDDGDDDDDDGDDDDDSDNDDDNDLLLHLVRLHFLPLLESSQVSCFAVLDHINQQLSMTVIGCMDRNMALVVFELMVLVPVVSILYLD